MRFGAQEVKLKLILLFFFLLNLAKPGSSVNYCMECDPCNGAGVEKDCGNAIGCFRKLKKSGEVTKGCLWMWGTEFGCRPGPPEEPDFEQVCYCSVNDLCNNFGGGRRTQTIPPLHSNYLLALPFTHPLLPLLNHLHHLFLNKA